MKKEEAINIINQHYTDAAPDKDKKELISASITLNDNFGAATRVAEKTKASPSRISCWVRVGQLPDDILGYVYMEKISVSSADIISRLDSTRLQRLVAIVSIEESLNTDYIKLLQKEISEEEKSAEDAIESVIGETTALRSVTLGFDQDTYLKLWAEAGRRRCTVGDLCESLINERIEQINSGELPLEDKIEKVQRINSNTRKSTNKFVEKIEDVEEDLKEIKNSI